MAPNLKIKIRRLKSQEINKLLKDTHVRNKASQNPYFKDEDAKEYLQDESLNNDDILPDSFNKICKQVASMEREIIEPDLKQLDHDRDLRGQQIKDRIEKAGEYQQEIQKTVDEIQENIRLENQMIEEQASKEELNRSEQFRVKLEESIGEAKAILKSSSNNTDTQEKNIKEICNIINKLPSSGIKDLKILNIDQLIKELEEIIQNENGEPENIDFCEDEVPGKLNNTPGFNGSKFLNDPDRNFRPVNPSFGKLNDKKYVDSRKKHNKNFLNEYQYDSIPKKSNSNITENLKDETLIDANKIKEALTQAKEHYGSTLNVFKSLDTNIKNYLNSSEVYQAIQDLQSQKHFEDIKESEESKRISSELQVLENINFDELKTKASKCKSLKNQLTYLNNDYKTLGDTINRYQNTGYRENTIIPVRRDLKNCVKRIEEHETFYDHLVSEIQEELISLLSIFETYYSKQSYPVLLINDITKNGEMNFYYFDEYMDKLKEVVISLKFFLKSELRKEGSNPQNSNNLLEDLNYTDFLNTILSGFTDKYLKNLILSINNLQLNLEQIEKEIIFPNGDKVKILNENHFAKKNNYNEESKESSEWTHLNQKYKDSENAAMLDQIEKNLSTSQDNSFYYNETLGKFKIECTICSHPNWISKETTEKIKGKILEINPPNNMSQVVQNNIIKSLDKLKKEIKIHNEDIATKQLTLNKTASYCQQVVEKVKGIFQENKLASDLIIECEDKINGTMSLIKENREKNILPKSENKPDSRDTQSFYNKFERENRFGLSISNQEQEEAKLSESNDRTSNQIKRISDNKAQFLIWSSLELRVKGYESILLQEKKKLTENFQKYCNSSVSTKHQDCCIELKTQNNIEYQMTSATVIPFNEQLRIQYLDNEYKELVSNAGKELTEACTKYKNQHFRLRTGLATVFPAGNLEFNNIIAAVPPITNNESAPQLLEKVILSILDIMLDHEFQSIMIPTFCTEDSEISEEQYIAILLKTLKEYIDENEQEMRGKRIVICFKTLPLPERDEQLDSLVKKYSKRVLKIEKTKIQREDKGIESSKGEKYYQDSREETKDEKVELSNCDSPIPSKQADDLENQIILLQEKKQQLQEQITSLKSEISQLEQKKKFILEESFNETTRDRRDQEDLDQDPKADISATTGNEYLQKENIELEHNCEELKEKYLKLKAKKKEIKKKNIELENKNTELKNTNAQLEKQIEKDIEEYNELVKRYEKYRNRCRAYKSKEESKGIPKVPRKLSRDHSHPPKMKSKKEIRKPTASNLHKSTLPCMLGGQDPNDFITNNATI